MIFGKNYVYYYVMLETYDDYLEGSFYKLSKKKVKALKEINKTSDEITSSFKELNDPEGRLSYEDELRLTQLMNANHEKYDETITSKCELIKVKLSPGQDSFNLKVFKQLLSQKEFDNLKKVDIL